MAREILNLTNVDVADSDYPYGRVRDNDGTGNGTPVNEAMLGDMLQFFNRLMSFAAISPNGISDNEYSGFQYFEAFRNLSDKYKTTSNTSVALGTIGVINFTVAENLSYQQGTNLIIYSASDPSKYMSGYVTTYSGSTLSFGVVNIQGTGTFTDWVINLGGIISATDTISGVVTLATQTEVNNSSSSGAAVIGSTLAAAQTVMGTPTGTKYYTKVVNIGDWDMDATASVTVAHGVTLANIRSVSASIRNDAGTSHFMLGAATSANVDVGSVTDYDSQAVIQAIDSTNVNLQRFTTGRFDTTDYDSTSYNRGWVTIVYEA